MAEVLGLVASVASLIALTSETANACNKLAKSINCFVNAPADVQKIRAELLDLAQILELFQSVLQPLRDGRAGESAQVDFIERSLARVRGDVQKVVDSLVSVQSKARQRNPKGRAKWIVMKDDITSMMTIVDRQKQNLLMQVNLLNLKIAHIGTVNLEDSRKDMKLIGSRVEGLKDLFRATNADTASRIENRVQSSTNSLQNSIRAEIHRTMSSIPRETNISRASLDALSVLVAKTVASQFESLMSKDSSDCPGRRPRTEKESNRRISNGSQTESVDYVMADTQVTVDDFREERPGDLHREMASSRLTSQTSVQKMTSFLGTMLIRRSNIISTFLKSAPESVIERSKVEIDFLPANWLQSWTGCGIFLARMGFGKPRFDLSIAVARVIDISSDHHAKRTLDAVHSGDLDALRGYFQSRVAYPTDRDEFGYSLLSRAAMRGQLDTCRLLLQQGAGIDINTPSKLGFYPVQHTLSATMMGKNYDLVRLFLSYDADTTLSDADGRSVGALTLYYFPYANAEAQKSGSLFRFLIESGHSFDIHQRDRHGRTPLMQARGQTRQVYNELLGLGADAASSDAYGSTVLHHFFMNHDEAIWTSITLDTFLDSGEILALLIRAGADAKAENRWGKRPYEVHTRGGRSFAISMNTTLVSVNLAFWHQALRISCLCEFEYCDCPAHHVNTTPLCESGCPCQSCLGGLNSPLRSDTFEEEMTAALKASDTRSIDWYLWGFHEGSRNQWAQKVLIELDTRRRRKAYLPVPADPDQSVGHLSEHADQERDETQTSNELPRPAPISAPREIDMHENWRTGCSRSSSDDEDWESAPEM